MSRIIAAIVISLIAGFAAGAWLLGNTSVPATDPNTEAAADRAESSTLIEERLRRLEQVMAEEREARLVLEEQLQILIDAMERIDSTDQRALVDQRALAQERRAERRTGERAPRDFVALMRGFEERRLNTLIDGGFSEDEARRVLQTRIGSPATRPCRRRTMRNAAVRPRIHFMRGVHRSRCFAANSATANMSATWRLRASQQPYRLRKCSAVRPAVRRACSPATRSSVTMVSEFSASAICAP